MMIRDNLALIHAECDEFVRMPASRTEKGGPSSSSVEEIATAGEDGSLLQIAAMIG